MASVPQLSTPSSGPGAANPLAPTSATKKVWLYRPSVDLLFGYGLLYLISVPLLMVASSRIDANSLPAWIGGTFLLCVTLPHYGATILRVYERRQERQRYALFVVWITAFVLLWFISGLYVQVLGSLLITLSVTWNPWHLSGQNFGLGVMYLRRQGVDVTPDLKRPLYTSFILSAALAAVWIHMPDHESYGTAQGHADASGTFRFLHLGLPTGVTHVLAAGLLVAYLGCLLTVAARLRGKIALSLQGPVWTLIAAQALWFTVPAFGIASGMYSLSKVGLPFLSFWIAAAHGAQYLWVTCYYEQRTERGAQPRAFMAKALLAGGALVIPGFLFAPVLLGPIAPNSAGVFALTFALINLHHCILDGAIWKLRDGRIARALLKDAPVDAEPIEAPRGHWLRNSLLALGGLVVILQAQLLFVSQSVNRPDAGLSLMRFATTELTWLGIDSPLLHAKLAAAYESNGEPEKAIASYRKAVEMAPQPPPWAANRLAILLASNPPLEKHVETEALVLARYLIQALGPNRSEGYETLATVHMAAGRREAASQAGETALRIARRNETAARLGAIQANLRNRGILTGAPR